MYPSIFNRFLVIQPVSSKVRHFSTCFAHFGLSWVYAPGTIAVNVTRLERGFNACKTPRFIPSFFNNFWDIARYWSKIATFHTHLCLAAPQGVTPSEFHEDLEWMGYRVVKKHDSMFNRFDTIPACDRRTDRRRDVQPIAITCVSLLTHAKNYVTHV